MPFRLCYQGVLCSLDDALKLFVIVMFIPMMFAAMLFVVMMFITML